MVLEGEIGGGRGGGGATDGTPRCEGRRLPRVGVGGVEWGQINGSGRRYFFPKVPAGMTRRGTRCMLACLYECACVSMCVPALHVWSKGHIQTPASHRAGWGAAAPVPCAHSVSVCGLPALEKSDDSPRASTQLACWHQGCMKKMLKLLVTQLLWWTTNCDPHVRHHKSASSKTAICEGNLIALVWFLCFFLFFVGPAFISLKAAEPRGEQLKLTLNILHPYPSSLSPILISPLLQHLGMHRRRTCPHTCTHQPPNYNGCLWAHQLQWYIWLCLLNRCCGI